MINIKKDIFQIVRFIFFLFLEVTIFFILSRYLGGIYLPNFETAFIIIFLLSIINALIWPIVSYISLKFLVFTLGFGTFIIDGLILATISYFITGVTIEGVALISVPLLIGIINSILIIIFGIDNEDLYYRFILKKRMGRNKLYQNEPKGYIFLEIDGLSYDILKEAINQNYMPTLKSWIDRGSHKLTSWETDLSSQTSSSQAGILHGNNNNIPAFRWVEKENNNKIISSNGFSDSHMIEERISNNNGLLAKSGASLSNLFTGDAEDYILTFSKLVDKSVFSTKTWYFLFSEPFFIARVLFLFLWDIIMELFSRIYHIIKNINPRLSRRGLSYFIARAGANVVMREASTSAIIGDIFIGKYDKVYTTYMGYDEIAHHSGIRDPDSFYSLKQIDRQFKYIENAVNHAVRDYNLIVLSDHGQSGGSTFKMKYGITLEDLVEKYLPEHIKVHSILHSNDDHIAGNFSIKKYAKENKDKIKEEHENIKNLIDIISSKKDSFKERKKLISTTESITSRIDSIADDFGINIHLSKGEVVDISDAQTIVLASGNLGLIYFTQWANRLSYEQLEDAFPGLIHGIASHPGIGFVMVKSAFYGTLVFCDDSTYYMRDDKYIGERFLDKYGENIVNHLKRTDSFDYVPDILVNSNYDEDTGEVYAFEELIGSHGGVGGTQQEPFILYPSDWSLDDKIIGSENVHKFFKKEMFNHKKE